MSNYSLLCDSFLYAGLSRSRYLTMEEDRLLNQIKMHSQKVAPKIEHYSAKQERHQVAVDNYLRKFEVPPGDYTVEDYEQMRTELAGYISEISAFMDEADLDQGLFRAHRETFQGLQKQFEDCRKNLAKLIASLKSQASATP